MKIDIHGHLTAPDSLYAWKAGLLSHRGAHGRGSAGVSTESLRESLYEPNRTFGNKSHIAHLDDAGIDLQLISPRPYQLMHSEQAMLVEWYVEETNNIIAESCVVEPDRFRGMAGLPQSMETGPSRWVEELRRCVTELGFVGALLNPDPYEGSAQPPALDDRFWYPVWEALCELDVPALIHSAGCRPPSRETYSLHFIQEETLAVIALATSQVFDDFPDPRSLSHTAVERCLTSEGASNPMPCAPAPRFVSCCGGCTTTPAYTARTRSSCCFAPSAWTTACSGPRNLVLAPLKIRPPADGSTTSTCSSMTSSGCRTASATSCSSRTPASSFGSDPTGPARSGSR
jgi:predicted TIM-barrel fold metal-dependent hydrolase